MNQDIPAGRRYPSTLRTSNTEKTVRLTNQIQISKTDTPNHLRSSFCLNNIFAAYFPILHLTCNPLLYLGPTSSRRVQLSDSSQVWLKVSVSSVSKSFPNLFTMVIHLGMFAPKLCNHTNCPSCNSLQALSCSSFPSEWLVKYISVGLLGSWGGRFCLSLYSAGENQTRLKLLSLAGDLFTDFPLFSFLTVFSPDAVFTTPFLILVLSLEFFTMLSCSLGAQGISPIVKH